MKFFRNIRKRFLHKNKFSKYLGYALGEIALVVIGILIALSINNRNQDRINEKNEQIYLAGLREEFQTSKLKLSELMAVNQANYIGAKEILRYTTANELPAEIVFSTLLYNTFSSDIAFNPNNSLLFEMINSGNLKNLSNTELRKKLTNWTATLEDISRQEKELAIQREKVLDMFRTNESSLSTIFRQAGVYDDLDLPKSGNDVSNLGLLKSTEFENNVLMFILTSYATEKAHYYPLMQDIDGILKLINHERN
ncbi:hypothetical protein GCM10007103_09870 [Salinimicrobium marinum]|uniref:Uncharacterized protein n=1 Tax=Salinimicrobium marinum TaxID=680283 RepID=A0A918S8M2_9FLAO|nr:DUF6090 family protein [Salinimicrobium marinum]GHA30487.1 hypothetical protein GCM10007103_09870 [Salinimicrobium marinum]